MVRDSSGWRMSGKEIESGMMTSTISALANLRADAFDDTLSTIPGHPILISVVGPDSIRLHIAPALPDSSKYFVRSSSSKQVFLVSKWTAEQILKPIEKHIVPEKRVQHLAAAPGKVAEQPEISSPSSLKKTFPLVTSTKKVEPPATKTTPSALPSKMPKDRKAIEKKIAPVEQQPTPITKEPEPVKELLETPPSTPKASPAQPAGSSADEDGDLTVYTVKKGETMQMIAKKYNVSVEMILKWNLLKSIVLKPGQELYIYVRK
jgi:LysM repeat protein